ncbi:unnamed protein product [Trichobilharzia szidati]|nr:unnamed protein product [Trichobilharzia szidati]
MSEIQLTALRREFKLTRLSGFSSRVPVSHSCIMEPRKVRKSWLSTSQEILYIASEDRNRPVGPISPLCITKQNLKHEESNNCDNMDEATLNNKYTVVLHRNENEDPLTVNVSDILSLSTFSRRAVVDFGSTTGKSLTRFLLLENLIDEAQSVVIQRGPPDNEFFIDWIASETDNNEFRSCYPAASKQIHLSPLHGRALLKITWAPARNSTSECVSTFHHVIQFRVNNAYTLQAVIIGRLLPRVEKSSRPKVWLKQAQFSTFKRPALPTWTENSFIKTSERCSRLDTSKKEKTNILRSRSNFTSPVSEIRHHHVRSSIERQTNKNEAINLNCSTAFFISGASEENVISYPQTLSESFTDQQEKTYDAQLNAANNRRRSCSQPAIVTPIKDLSVFGRFHEMKELSSPRRSTSISNRLCSDMDLTMDTNFLNSTATAFVSPKLVRSPALKGAAHSVTSTTHKRDQGGNLFYSNVTSVLSEMSVFGLTQWLNGIFAPCIAANSYNGHVSSGSKEICVFGSPLYHSTVKKAVELLSSTALTVPGERIEREIDTGKLMPIQDTLLRVDKGSQRRIQDLLLTNCAPIWLHLTVDSLSSISSGKPNSSTKSNNLQSTVITDTTTETSNVEDDKSNNTTSLSKKIHTYLFESFVPNKSVLMKSDSKDTKSKQAFQTASVKNDKASAKPNAPSRDVLFNRHVVKRFIIFVWIMDYFKSHMLIKYDPCLFRVKSHIKSTSSLLMQFAQYFLYGVNNLVRQISYLGAEVKVNQTQLDEYQFNVENLAVDLRDGVRLVKLAELLIPTLSPAMSIQKQPTIVVEPGSLMSMVRFPAISRLQKIHNVGLALKAFQQYGEISMVDGSLIDPRDIVDGHREKTLTLLWCILLRYQVLALLDHSALENEIQVLEIKVNSLGKNIDEVNNFKPNTVANSPDEDKWDAAHFKLLHWAYLVCQLYDVTITSLDESFADGRALCYLLHHYLPTILPQGLIRQFTTQSANSSIPIPNSILIRNNLFNLSLFQRKLAVLGDVPLLLTNNATNPTPLLTSTDSILPPGLVLTTLAYLVNRLVVGPEEKHKLHLLIRDNAACIIQNAWRRFQDHMKFSQFKLVPYGREWRMQRRMTRACIKIQAYVRGYLVRKYVAEIRLARNTAATVIQSYVRRYLAQCYIKRLHKSATLIQSTWRGYVVQRSYTSIRTFFITIQAYSRGFLARRYVAQLQANRNAAAIVIQSYFRRFIVQRDICNWHKSAIQIQSAWRCYHARREYLQLREACLTVQRYVRGYHARKYALEMRTKMTSAAIVFQSHFRGYLVRRQISCWHSAAIHIQKSWRCYYYRQRFLSLKSQCISVQRYARGYLARKRLAEIQSRRNSAAIVIQSHFRRYLVCREINLWHSSALQIQKCWRSYRHRKIITQFQEIVSLVLTRHNASVKIQSWWRACYLSRLFNRQRLSAIRIQATWRGFRLRKHLLTLTQPSKISSNSTKVLSHQTINRRGNFAASIPLKLKSAPKAGGDIKSKPPKEKVCLLSLSSSEAKSLLGIRSRLNKATQRARIHPNLTLVAKARNALKQLSQSTSINQIIDAIKFLQMATGLSVELCYWIVGLPTPNSLSSSENNENSPSVLIRFFQIMMACNRSVPHEDIFVAITGTLLNIGRHKNLACNTDIWWNPLFSKFKSSDNEENVNNNSTDDIEEEFSTPAIVHSLNTQLRRYQSLPGLNAIESDIKVTLPPCSLRRTSTQAVSTEQKLNSLSISENMCLIEVLVGILQRTWRARPGTVSIRLFSRTCCVLALLFTPAPADLFLINSSLLAILREIHEGLYRRSDPHSQFHLNFDPTGNTTNSLSVSDLRIKLSNADVKKIRTHLSCDLDWHFKPIKTRPNPLLAIHYLLYIVEKKMSSA